MGEKNYSYVLSKETEVDALMGGFDIYKKSIKMHAYAQAGAGKIIIINDFQLEQKAV